MGYGPGYYAGFVDTHGMLAVADPTWEVTVWREVDGELEEVTKVTVDGAETAEGKEDKKGVVVVVEDDGDTKHYSWRPKEIWGALSAGVILTPFRPDGTVTLPQSRVTANETEGWSGALRGLDLRWHTFWLRDRSRRRFNFPSSQWYFRSGYSEGQVAFGPEDPAAGFQDGDATHLRHLTVPLFFGGNIYLFRRFPIRPYVGLGTGFDILRVEYQRHNANEKVDVSARIGFELHAGLEIRINNRVQITGEVMQLWSARRELSGVPDFANEGFTVVTGVAVGFPLHRRTAARAKRKAPKPAPRPPIKVEVRAVEPAPEPAPEPEPEPEPEPAGAGPFPTPRPFDSGAGEPPSG
ncbi:MAG: hypothetical protein JRH11_28465 [Deltaproteobacteria bacterium]|nr:hypothetical protein [Deltaproteobacteria bacterium]